jgi:hypothetical protein
MKSYTLGKLLERCGEDHVCFQRLDECTSNISQGKKGSRVTFVTTMMTPSDAVTGNGENVGYVVWVNRKRLNQVKQELANEPDEVSK